MVLMDSTEFNLMKEISSSFIEVNGIKLHVVQIGKGEPLILLHGFPDFWYSWKKLILELKDYYHLIIPDLRGYNLSDKPSEVEDYKIPLLIEDVIGIGDKLELEKFYLVGHDWGGALAYCIAEKYPSRIKKLAVLNGPHLKLFQEKLLTDEDQKKASWYISEFLKPGDKNELSKNMIQKFTAGAKSTNNPDLEEYIKFWSRKGGIRYWIYAGSIIEKYGQLVIWLSVNSERNRNV